MSCHDCHFYSQNPFLRCAVRPEIEHFEGCVDWKARSPNSNVGHAVDLHGRIAFRTVQGFVHLQPEHLSGDNIHVEIVPFADNAILRAVDNVTPQAFRAAGISLEEAQAAIQKLANSSVSVNDIRNAIARLAVVSMPEDPKDAAIELISMRHRVSRAIATFRLESFLSRHPHLTVEVAYKCLMDGRIKFRFGRLTPGKGFPKPKGDRPTFLRGRD